MKTPAREMIRTPDTSGVVAEIEQLVQRLERLPDSNERDAAQELVRLVMSLYGDAMSHMLDIIRSEHGGPQAVLDRFAQDGLIASLLVLHDLHPQPTDLRVVEALSGLQPHLPPHLTLTMTALTADTVRVRVDSGADAHAMPANLRPAVERAVQEAAPEIAVVEIEGLHEPVTGALIQITRRTPEAPPIR
jgi:hypothetical protein